VGAPSTFEDLLLFAAVAMRAGLTRDDLAATHYVFPTLVGSVLDAIGREPHGDGEPRAARSPRRARGAPGDPAA
jgi:hypothetical protein